jgi:hypothetical protein
MVERWTIGFVVWVLKAMMRRSEKSMDRAFSIVRSLSSVKARGARFFRFGWLYRLINFPSFVASGVTWEFQEDIAGVYNLPRCDYCRYVMYTNAPHNECEEEWERLHGSISASSWEEPEDETDDMCPCGHRRHQHYLHESQCDCHGCGCPEFGTALEEWYESTQIWFTEPPSGHNGWE